VCVCFLWGGVSTWRRGGAGAVFGLAAPKGAWGGGGYNLVEAFGKHAVANTYLIRRVCSELWFVILLLLCDFFLVTFTDSVKFASYDIKD